MADSNETDILKQTTKIKRSNAQPKCRVMKSSM